MTADNAVNAAVDADAVSCLLFLLPAVDKEEYDCGGGCCCCC